MLISFSKAWGQDEYRWNYSGGDYNFKSIIDFMEFYGIEEAWISGKEIYWEGEKEMICNEYSGRATKEIERLKKHWVVEYCKPCAPFKSHINKRN